MLLKITATNMQGYVLALLLRQAVSDMSQGEINVIIGPLPKKGNCRENSKDGSQRFYKRLGKTQY